FPKVTMIACWGALIIGAIYMLRAMRNIFHGPLAEKWAHIVDAPHLWRKMPFILLLASLLVFGFFPRLLTDRIGASVKSSLAEGFASKSSTDSGPRSDASANQ